MEYKWKQTTHDVYLAVYNEHKKDLHVFESYTEKDSRGEKLKAQITAWGFAEADHPIIRSEFSEITGWKYSILKAALDIEN